MKSPGAQIAVASASGIRFYFLVLGLEMGRSWAGFNLYGRNELEDSVHVHFLKKYVLVHLWFVIIAAESTL